MRNARRCIPLVYFPIISKFIGKEWAQKLGQKYIEFASKIEFSIPSTEANFICSLLKLRDRIKTTGSSFDHQYVIEQFETLKNELQFVVGSGHEGAVDRAISLAKNYDRDDFPVFLRYFLNDFIFISVFYFQNF